MVRSLHVAVAVVLALDCTASLGAEVRTLVVSEEIVTEVVAARGGPRGFTLGWRAGNPGAMRIQRFSTDGSPEGPVVQVTDSDLNLVDSMAVARDGAGNDLVIWRTTSGFVHVVQRLFMTAFDATGARLFPIAEIPGSGGIDGKFGGYSAAEASGGGWIAAWSVFALGGPDRVFSQKIATGGPTGPATLLADQNGTWSYLVGLARASEGMLAIWSSLDPYGDRQKDIVGLLLDENGVALGTPQTLVRGEGRALSLAGTGLGGTGEGRFLLTYLTRDVIASSEEYFGMELNGATPAGAPFHLGGASISPQGTLPSFGVDRVGRTLFSWTDRSVAGPSDVAILRQGRLLSGSPLTPATEVLVAFGSAPPPTASVGQSGDWVVAWPRIPTPESNFSGIDAELGSFQNGCEPSDDALCLSGARFLATATYHDHLGRDGAGHAVALTPESGTFWFFTPANVELILKVVDACGHPDFRDFWVYASGLTDVEVTLTVVDTWTGEIWERSTDLGEPFPPILDSQAFHACDATPLVGPAEH